MTIKNNVTLPEPEKAELVRVPYRDTIFASAVVIAKEVLYEMYQRSLGNIVYLHGRPMTIRSSVLIGDNIYLAVFPAGEPKSKKIKGEL